MASFGFNFPEDDCLKDLSIELTSHKEWLDRIETQGNKPEDWVEFIEHTKSQFSLSYDSFWNGWICDLYVKALKSIPGDLSKNNVMFVKLWIDYANLKSENNADDGHMLFSQARSIARKFSIAHIAAAEFELKQGNKEKCQKILEKAEIFSAEPASLLKKAFQNLKANESYLLTASEKANYFEKKKENVEEKKPPLTSSVGLPERSAKNKFLVDIMVSHAPVISNLKNEPHSSSEKVFQPTDPFAFSEKWVSGSLLSDKWDSYGNFSTSDGRLSSIFSAPDRRLSSIHNVVDRRLSSIHTVTASHGSSSLSHYTTPDYHKPYKNGSDNNSSGGSSSSSSSRLFNVTSLPRRVKVKSKSLYELDDEDDDSSSEGNNTIANFKPAMPSGKAGLSFLHKCYINPITEEDNIIANRKSTVKGQESLKADKFDHKSSIMSQISEKNDNVNINPFSTDKDVDDDFPELPTPPKFSLSFMRNIGEKSNPLSVSSSSSLSTTTLSASASFSAREKTKPPTTFVRTSLNPYVFAEPNPVAKFVKPPPPKCHPDTPRPDTGTPPLSDNKENVVAPPPLSRRCLDNLLKTTSPATGDRLTLSDTLKACMITVSENITDTVVFEGKPADNFHTPSGLPPAKLKSFQGTTLSSSSSSSITKRPYLSDINPFDMGNKLDSALSKPDSLLPNCDKENRPSSYVTPAKFRGGEKSSWPNLKERLSEHVEVESPPEPAKMKPDRLSESRLSNPFQPMTEGMKPVAVTPTGTPTVVNLKKENQLVASYEAEKPQMCLPNTVCPTPMAESCHKELRETDKMFNPKIKLQVDQKPTILQGQLPSAKNGSHFKNSNADKNRSVPDAQAYAPSRESASVAQKKEQLSQRNVQSCENEFVVPQSLMDKGKQSNNSDCAPSKASPLLAENGGGGGPSDTVQLKEQKSKPVQPKPELQSQKSQQNRVEHPLSSFQGPVTYTMSLNQPIKGKKLRSLTVNGNLYVILKMIGRGGSSKVYQVLDSSCNMMAVKHIDFEGATEATIKSYMNEVTLLKHLQYSDLVVKLHNFELDDIENCLYLVLECGETDLATMFKNRTKKEKIPREMVKFYWGEMLRAVQVLHKEGIVHSDLKPANFLIVGGNLKLIDFGIAGLIQNDRTSMTRDTQMGTLNYMSPETILEMQSDTGNCLHKFKISVKSDIWSLGCILYSMNYGKTPFQHITNHSMKLQAIINVNHHIEFGDEYDTDLVDTMKKCLCRNPKERLSISELLQHPYLVEKTKAAPSEQNLTEGASGDVKNWVNNVQCIFDNLVHSNVASPNTIRMLKTTILQKLGSEKEIKEVLSTLLSSKKSSQPNVSVKSENIGKMEVKPKCENGGIKEVRAPLQCLNLKDLRREKLSKDSLEASVDYSM